MDSMLLKTSLWNNRPRNFYIYIYIISILNNGFQKTLEETLFLFFFFEKKNCSSHCSPGMIEMLKIGSRDCEQKFTLNYK